MPGPAVNELLRGLHVGEVNRADQVEFEREILVVNTGMQYGVESLDGYNNLMPRRNARISALLGSERSGLEGLATEKLHVLEKLKIFSSRLPLLSMLNVKYIISGYEMPETQNLRLIHTAYPTRFKIPIYLYENTTVLPRVYLANSVSIISDTDEIKNFTIITDPANDFSKVTYLECADCQSKPNQPSAKDRIVTTAYKEGLLNLTASIANGRWLVFSESNLPGWEISIDGVPTTSVVANYLFHGVYIPKGDHEVRFEYRGLNFR